MLWMSPGVEVTNFLMIRSCVGETLGVRTLISGKIYGMLLGVKIKENRQCLIASGHCDCLFNYIMRLAPPQAHIAHI